MAPSPAQQTLAGKAATTDAEKQYSVATTTAKVVETKDWLSFSNFKPFKIQFKYPGPPTVLAEHVVTSNAGYLQISLPNQFDVTIDASPMDRSLDQWLYEPPQPDDHSNYQFIMQEIQSSEGMYLASTTIDGASAIEIGFDCSKISGSTEIPRFQGGYSGWEYGYYDQIITVRTAIFYRFTAYDVCKFPKGFETFPQSPFNSSIFRIII
jgi:hypothetical protein